jgi:hypothetical protein
MSTYQTLERHHAVLVLPLAALQKRPEAESTEPSYRAVN